MHQIVGYHRPATVADALALLADAPPHAAVGRILIGGGTTVRHDGGSPPVEVIDLQALGLGDIAADGERIRLGATATLHRLTIDPLVPDLLARAARAEQPSTLRTLATVGGTVGAADPDSVLLAGLLVHGAIVHLADGGDVPLAEVLAGGVAAGRLIVAVSIEPDGRGAIAATGRTPADVPIVAAVGRATADGPVVALTGVAPVPRLCPSDQLDELDPPGDFRGSPEYRRRLAAILSARVLAELG